MARNFLKDPVSAGATELRVLEVVVAEKGARPETKKAYYTSNGKREVIPPLFSYVDFLSDKVALASDFNKTYRIRFDITGVKPAVIDTLPYYRIRQFEAGRMNADARAVRRVWYGISVPRHKVQYEMVDDLVILDEQGEPAATIHDVIIDRPGSAQQGHSLMLRVMPAEGRPLYAVTDLAGQQIEPVMPGLQSFEAIDDEGYHTDPGNFETMAFRVLALPVEGGRFAPFTVDGRLRRLTAPGLLGYRPQRLERAHPKDYLRGWWVDYDLDGKRLMGWAHPDLSKESGPIWVSDSIRIDETNGLVAQRLDGSWEFYPGPGALLDNGGTTPIGRLDEFPWSAVTPRAFETQAKAFAAADVFVDRQLAVWAEQRAEQEEIARRFAARRVAEVSRRQRFAAAVAEKRESLACNTISTLDDEEMYREVDLVVRAVHRRDDATAVCGIRLSTLAQVLPSMEGRAIAAGLRQMEAKREAQEQAAQVEREQEAQRQYQAHQAAVPAMNGGAWAPRRSSFDAEASRAYTKALQDWTYGKTSWRPRKD